MSLFIDYLAGLGLDAGKDYLIDKKKDGEISRSILSYIERQNNINEICELAEEIDFQGISEYILSELLLDVKVCLFGNKSDREVMKETIYSKAISYSKAGSKRQQDKVKKLIDDSLDILCNFYRMQIDDTDLFMSAETIDAIVKELKKELDKKEESISAKIESGNQRVIDEIKKIKRDGCSKVAESVLLRELHEFIMKNYIKERYRKEELSEQDIEIYSDLFKLCIDICNDKGRVEVDGNIFDFVKDVILNQKKGNLIKIAGPDGTGKNTFLSILYIYLYRYCLDNGFSFCPFYINLHFYDTVIGNSGLGEQEMKNVMYKDLERLNVLVKAQPDIPYIIIIDGNENYFRTTLKTAKYFNDYINDFSAHKKIVCIGERTNIYVYRERKKYTYMYARMLYTFRFKAINNYETDKWKKFIHFFTKIDGNRDLTEDINSYLDRFDLDEVDFNILNVFKKCYDSDVLSGLDSISDLYKNYCMAYLRDTDDFEDSARMSYEYFMTNKKFSQDEIARNNREWNLIHQHKTISNFLIAYYYVGKIKNFSGKEDIGELEYLFPKDVNIFIKPLINESLEVQELILDKCKQVYGEGRILAKSQALYMMGRITHKSLRADILSMLENYYNDLYEQLIEKEVMQTEQEERDAHLLLRSVIISLVYLGKKDKREAYLKMLLNYPVANQINRGFHLEYYGDVPRKPDSRMYNYNDDGTNSIDITYNVLMNRIEHYLSSVKGMEDLNFQINLFTLCSLVQARLGKDGLSEGRIRHLKEIIDITLQKEQGNINIDFRAYLTMLKEDIEKKTYFPYFLYEKLYGVKNIVRKGWEQGIINDVINKPYENVAEHIYYTWMLGMLYLPEEPPKEMDYKNYDKKKVLDAVLIHDWAEIDVGDAVPSEDTEERRELEDFRMRVLLMHDTYSYIGNMLQCKKVWDVYNRGKSDINGKIAYELDKIQALYQFYQYRSQGAEFTDEKVLDWENEKNKITTSLGKKILKEIMKEKNV
ncbi:HD domain-containing protein [bacterium D16-51]|nr:HD domain-containing protein [bacterium D16-59]RKI56314.1 HD domain-containing protein [bacterium D16-51]